MMLTPSPGIPGNHLTEALSKRHPKGASVASLRLFMIKSEDSSRSSEYAGGLARLAWTMNCDQVVEGGSLRRLQSLSTWGR